MKFSRVLTGLLVTALLAFGYVVYQQRQTIDLQRRVMLEMYFYIKAGCPHTPPPSGS